MALGPEPGLIDLFVIGGVQFFFSFFLRGGCDICVAGLRAGIEDGDGDLLY